VGKPVANPKPGDIVVFWRESPQSWKGHVGFFMGFNQDGSKVFSLGGNQGDSVSIKAYDAGKVLGFRRVAEVLNIDIPQPVLKLGARGDEVMKLQILLNYLGYDCGDEDGIFGNKTDNALRLLQANNMITIDGVYGNQTKGVVKDLLFG
jgi:peptidoglycan hydrolase-like protein with peptidoglycan-binding domain